VAVCTQSSSRPPESPPPEYPTNRQGPILVPMPRRAIDLTGRQFGRLTVLSRVPSARATVWLCRCDCGKQKAIRASTLIAGRSRSCGCLNQEVTVQRNRKHGMAPRHNPHPLFGIWSGMMQRCENRKTASYPRYGGRGIRVCGRWRDFPAFVADMCTTIGMRPGREYSIDRINNDGNYEPGNVRWATRDQQAANQRFHKLEPEAKKALNVLGNHAKWHIRRGIVNPRCPLCA